MAKGDPVPPEEDVVRYARPEDFDDGILNGSAFDRLEKDHDGLSVTRLHLLVPGDPGADLQMIRKVLRSRRIPLAREGRLAQINVGEIIAVGLEADTILKVLEAPSKGRARDNKMPNPAHAIIDGLPLKGMEIGSLNSEYVSDLLRIRVAALHSAVDDPAPGTTVTVAVTLNPKGIT